MNKRVRAAELFPGRVKMDIPSSSGSTPVRPFLRTAPEQEKFLPERVREHNKALVLRTLYHGGQQSRADLARATSVRRWKRMRGIMLPRHVQAVGFRQGHEQTRLCR